MPTLIHLLLLKLLRVGIITACSGNSFQTVSCVKKVNFLFFLCFPIRAIENVGGENTKKKKKKKKKNNQF